MDYRSYMHIEKLGTTEVDGILNGTCYLSYKIDGTNASVWLTDKGELGFGSRKKQLSLDQPNMDNADFMRLITDDKALYQQLLNYLQIFPTRTIYGEWLVPHTIKRYNADAWRKFYVFDVFDNATGKYLNYDSWATTLQKACPNLVVIPLIAKLENPTQEEIVALLDKTGDFLCTEGIGEGIVIKNYDFVNRYGRTTWAKILTEDFKKQKDKTRANNAEAKAENATEHAIIQLLTPEHIYKERDKILEAYGEWSSKHIFELLNRVYTEFLHDNFDIILKKFKLPTINFRVLKQMSDNKVKETICF